MFLIVYHLSLLNKEREEQEKFLIRQSKLASMGEMISLIAHQWRQPLSVINGIVLNMDIDYRKKKLDEKRLDTYLNEIESTTGYLSNTINDFTEFFSTNKQSQVFNLSNIIDRAKQLSNISSHKNIELIYQKDETIYIKGHGSELIQSLLVLINNSIYQVNLKTIEEGKIFIYVSSVDNNILISVEDNGGGIKKKEMKKIFDPYFTTKEKHHGTGLGLYILKLIVEDSMNGKVFVSNGKEGAIFTIRIPKNME
jgi:signal transduction histidine kinase